MIEVSEITLSLGAFPLLDHIQFHIKQGERLALIGRNGAGKSTLLKIMAGIESADSGSIKATPGFEIILLPQALPPKENKTVYMAVAEGLSDLSGLLDSYHEMLNHPPSEAQLSAWQDKLNRLQSEIELRNGWQIQQRIERVIQDLALPADALMSSLSGGWRKRVALAKALVREPDLLLLDEPTNHLDIEAIQWLESYLLQYPKSLLFITHDRVLMQRVATAILELDRGKITRYPDDYQTYLARKEKALEIEQTHHAKFDKLLSQEEAWIRQGIKARRTRNEGRVRALEKLRQIRKARQEQLKGPSMRVAATESVGKRVFSFENITFGYDVDAPLIKDFTFHIQSGDKVAIIGPNGIGKSTLIQLMLGTLLPQKGKILSGANNQVVYFDQHRDQINLEKSLIDNVAEGDDFIEINGKRQHIISYLGDFLFSPEQARTLAKTLSGGEINRLLLAKIFSKPANVLILDEPTNDLDIESLEVLESLLLNYSGTLIVISHDRQFIDHIATHYIGFERDGTLIASVGGYQEYAEQLLQKQQKIKSEKNIQKKTVPAKSSSVAKTGATAAEKQTRKLSYNEQRELELLPQRIEKLESEIAILHQEMADPVFFQQDQKIVREHAQQLEALEQDLQAAYARWEMLDG